MNIIHRVLLGLLAFLTLPPPAHAAWLEARSKHFIVYTSGSEKQVRRFVDRLEKFDFLLRRLTDTSDDNPGAPVSIYVLRSDDQVRKLTHNPNIGGFYATTDREAYAVVSGETKSGQFDIGAEEILFHEYTHHFMLHYFPAAYPAWYVEGFAEFFSVLKFPDDGSIQFGLIPQVRAPTLRMQSIYPLKDLLARDTQGLNRLQGDRYYGTAWLLTHYFHFNKARSAEFRHYLNDLMKGAKDLDPNSYFQGGLAQLEKELRAYMNQRLSANVLSGAAIPPVAVAVGALDDARSALMDEQLIMMRGVPRSELPKYVADVRSAVAGFPDSAFAFALLADAELSAGNKDAALAAADKAIALDPHMARAFSTRANVLMDRANHSEKEEDWKAALSAIVKANRADTEDPVPLVQFFRYHAMKNGDVPPLAYDGLQKAFQMLPQNAGYRFLLSEALARKGKYAMASTLLDPIAYSPHESEERTAAQQLKAHFEEAEKKGALPAGEDAPEGAAERKGEK